MGQSYLEYCIQYWWPHLKREIVELGKVQMVRSNMSKGLKHLRYEEVLQHLGLFELEKQWKKGGHN